MGLVDEGGARRHSEAPRWSRRRRILALGGLAALAAIVPPGCCLVRPPEAKTLLSAGNGGFRTPEAAFETFRVAFGADLPELEFRSLSDAFRAREQISYQSYRIAREKLIEANPLLKLLAEAKVVKSEVRGDGRHHLVVEAAGQQFAVELVRQDEFQIYSGAQFLADGSLEFARAVKTTKITGGQRVSAEIFLSDEDTEGVDISKLTSLRVEQVWKIDGFGEAFPRT